jgi:hypothetical protein
MDWTHAFEISKPRRDSAFIYPSDGLAFSRRPESLWHANGECSQPVSRNFALRSPILLVATVGQDCKETDAAAK